LSALKILNTLDLSGVPSAVCLLEAAGQLISIAPKRDLVISNLHDAVVYFASASVVVDRELLDAAPKLALIASPSTGTDHLDLVEIAKRGITCFDISKEFDLINSFSATSELAFAMLLALNRNLINAASDAKEGVWSREKNVGFQLLGKTFGIVGLGRLGKISTRIARGFGMRVIATDPFVDQSNTDVELLSLEDVLRHSDVISIHVHLNEATRGMIGRQEFNLMKSSAIIINTSRGKIIDEIALLEALDRKIIAGACLDVIDGEWLSSHELGNHPLVKYSRSHNNILIMPHIGGSTWESIYGAREFMAKRICNWIAGNSNGL